MKVIQRRRLKSMNVLGILQAATCLLWCSTHFFVRADSSPTCQPADFHYEFTECDELNGRWRVSVPHPEKCDGGAPNPPVRVNSCSQACDPGQFFNLTDMSCTYCPFGTYSLGGGDRFEDWTTLPTGFYIHVDSPRWSENTDVLYQNCSKSGWQPRGDFIATSGVECTSNLVFSAKLVKPGAVRYKYQHSDDNIMFTFRVQNDQCQTIDDALSSKWPILTEDGEWREETVLLKTGLNVLYWKVTGINFDSKNHKPIMIKMIEINGLAYASSCTPCPAGTYSNGNASSCTPCPINTYSGKGARECVLCKIDKEYAGIGAVKCIPRPPCMPKDYFAVNTPCDENKMTQKIYKWIEPKICLDDLINATKLPVSGMKGDCPPCNPGMETNSSSGECTFCPKNYFSDGKEPCQSCPPSTVPNYGYQFVWWNSWPNNMMTSCFKLSDDNCSSEKGWILAGDHIYGGKDLPDDVYLTIMLNIPGFQSREAIHGGKATEIAVISFVFELDCHANCQLYFMQPNRKKAMTVIQTWTGHQEKQQFSYVITQNHSMSFMWAFQKVDWDKVLSSSSNDSYLFSKDLIKIYSINVTNTIDGGASFCQSCPKNSKSNGCIPCPAGHYIDFNTSACIHCPPLTFVTDYMAKGIESCQSCGPNLYSKDGQSCKSDCLAIINHKKYDFTPISGFQKIVGNPLFTASGTHYYHIFNISLCGSKAICKDNITYQMDDQEETFHIKAFICRTTIIPARGSDDPTVATQSINLGDNLLGVTENSRVSNMTAISSMFGDKSKDLDKAPDINFFYSSSEVTHACPNGRSTIITLRCDTKAENNGSLSMPLNCPYGTCDGCHFHIMWHSKYACPLCTEDDFEVVKGECIKSKQIIHYIPPNYCQLSDSLAKKSTKTMKCSVLVFEIQLLIVAASGLGLILIILLIYLWKKNQKLEYKYMRLVQSASAKDGELPKAESCAIDEGEDEDHFDAIHFQESKGKKFFNKLKSITKKGDGSNPFETIQLTSEKDSLT